MGGEAFWLGSEDPRWEGLLSRAAAYDTYHLPAWHRLAAAAGEGEPRLFVYREAAGFIALPLLLRPIPGTDGLFDATSVYGYAGPVTGARPPSAGMGRRFRAALTAAAREQRLVSVFARLHPLIEQAPLLTGLGELRPHGHTVSIDLTLPPAAQLAAYRRDHRKDLVRLREAGFACSLDPDFEHLDRFIDIYHDNMRRVGASAYYFFERRHFHALREQLGERLLLLICRHGTAIVGGKLVLFTAGIAQAYLSGISTTGLRLTPSKLLMDAAREHAQARGARVLHLGGGRGGGEDSLFHFKAGFSDRRHLFQTWRWIVEPGLYSQLGGPPDAAGFFPAYRAPGPG